MIDAEIWYEADQATRWRQSQVQGFLYDTNDPKAKRHVIRDCTKPEGEQWLWENVDQTGERYEEIDKEQERLMEIYKIGIIIEEYERRASRQSIEERCKRDEVRASRR